MFHNSFVVVYMLNPFFYGRKSTTFIWLQNKIFMTFISKKTPHIFIMWGAAMTNKLSMNSEMQGYDFRITLS